MSFITKRERVFNEYDLFDLPARNEGKLKTYASCTDARAWSHFCSDKTEHLVEIIKRNNKTVQPKYVPTEIIVNTLMVSKNAEITRLKRKIEEFEQMLAAYDQLELTCEQKCDIANAHAAIKAANKELDDMCLDLDLSGYTEGIDSEAFETGKSQGDELRYTGEIEKSRGDEWMVQKESTPRMETKSNQFGESCTQDAITSAYDTRIDDLQETIICKDAKLNAMQNTIAVMENDVCEPYCVYAHIYTALEKIFGILCQNEKYKEYLDLLTTGKVTRGIDIKGKILFKIKVLEKFSLALIAPCSQNYSTTNDHSCYHAEIVTEMQTTFALTSAEINKPNIDNTRAQLIADIIHNDDIKEVLSNESFYTKIDDDQLDECYVIDNYNIDVENLKRLKNLQSNYEDLLNCYENLKHERDCLKTRYQKYVQLEQECECLQNKLREYNQLWKEKEYYRHRSDDLDTLKENYLVLADEISNVETRLRAEQEINKVKSRTVDELQNENVKLDNKLTEVSLTFEKQKNILVCKLKEGECKIMCQEQQIKSLSLEIDSFLEKDANKIPTTDESQSLELFDEIESQKDQIKNLKDALCCNEEEKQYYQNEFEKQLKIINQLKLDVEDWKSKYEKALQSNNYLEKYLEDYHIQMKHFQETNRVLSLEIEKKISAIDNLNDIVSNKSQEVNHLMHEIDLKKEENEYLVSQIKSMHDDFNKNLQLLETEKTTAITSIHSARQESLEIFESFNNYNDKKKDTSNRSIQSIESEIYQNNTNIGKIIDGNKKIIDSDIVKEIKLLREINLENINILRRENTEMKKSLNLAQKQSEILNEKILNQDNLIDKLQQLSTSHESLIQEKYILQHDLDSKTNDVNNLLKNLELTSKKSEDLLDQLKKSERDYLRLDEAYMKVLSEKNDLQKEISRVGAVSKELTRCQVNIDEQNEIIHLKSKEIKDLKRSLSDLNKKFVNLQEQKQMLQKNFDEKCNEIAQLNNNLENKIDENCILSNNYNILKIREIAADNNVEILKRENSSMKINLNTVHKQSSERLNKIKYYESLEHKYNNLLITHDQIDLKSKELQNDLHTQLQNIKKLEQENCDLKNENITLISINKDLEKALISTRNQTLLQADSQYISYTDIKLEIENLKAEKINSNKKIRELEDKLDESEFTINDLTEAIIARDKKKLTLENYINNLEDEIKKLQLDLYEVVESGEEIKKLSNEKIHHSQKLLEAHHSKAIHNMKMELAKSQNEKERLESQLSTSNLLSRESSKENQTFICNLQQEREQIVSDIRLLELKIFKESSLNQYNCTVREVIDTLDKIGKYLDYKNISLEKTLLSVQDSYQILKTKADEAKNIAEKERQKIIDEKDEMQKDRKIIENELEDLRNKLEKDKILYENLIRDLNCDISNQNLIFDKMKQIKDAEILKLKVEKLSLQNLYENLSVAQKDVQEKLKKEYDENSNKQDLIEKVTLDLKGKNEDIFYFQNIIDELKNKHTTEFGTQASVSTNKIEVATEIDNGEKYITPDNLNKSTSCDITKELQEYSESVEENVLDNFKLSELLHNVRNTESSLDLLKHIYIKYKMKKLCAGRPEHYSISGIDYTNVTEKNIHELQNNCNNINYSSKCPSLKKTNINSMPINDSIVNIYNTKTLTDSTKNTSENKYVSGTKIDSIKSSGITDLTLNNDIFKNNFVINNGSKNNAVCDGSPTSTDEDLFLIYEDSQSSSVPNQIEKPWSSNGYTNVIVERAAIHTNKKYLLPEHRENTINKKNKVDEYSVRNNGELSEDDSIMPKLNVSLPRVLTDHFSTVTISNDEKFSTDSNMIANDMFSKKKVYSDTNISNKNYKYNEFDKSSTTINVDDNNNLNKSNDKCKNVKDIFNNEKSFLMQETQHKPRKIERVIQKNINTGKKHSTNLSRINGNTQVLNNKASYKLSDDREINDKNVSYSFQETDQSDFNKNIGLIKAFRKSQSDNTLYINDDSNALQKFSSFNQSSTEYSPMTFRSKQINSALDRAILVKMDTVEDYEEKIMQLTKTLQNIEKEYKNKIEAIKVQYDSNVKRIINEHNEGVKSIQSLHEEKLYDIIKTHENEIENLRAMSIEALRKVERLENENRHLKSKLEEYNINIDEVPVKIVTPELKRKKIKCRADDKMLTQTNVAVFDVKPKRRSYGPCTCSIDVTVSDTIRNLFEQVDVEQKKMAEQNYLKHIANKILSKNVEVLDAQELSFLHLKVCRIWKTRLNKEETLQKRIDSLECELMNKQRQTHEHMAELDRKVAEEWKRLQEVREAVCCSPNNSDHNLLKSMFNKARTAERDVCNSVIEEELSACELEPEISCICRPKRLRASNRAVLAKLDTEERKEKTYYSDETPIRLKRSRDHRLHKK